MELQAITFHHSEKAK